MARERKRATTHSERERSNPRAAGGPPSPRGLQALPKGSEADREAGNQPRRRRHPRASNAEARRARLVGSSAVDTATPLTPASANGVSVTEREGVPYPSANVPIGSVVKSMLTRSLLPNAGLAV